MIQNTPNTSYLRYNAPSGAISPEQRQAALKESLNQTKDNPAVKAATDTTNDPKVLLGAIGIWGLLKMIVKPINKAISGEYKDSFLGKIGSAGDKASDVLHLNNLSKPSSKIKNWAENNRFFKYFSSSYKTTPKNTFAASMAKGTMGELAQDASQVIEACKKQNIDLSKMFDMDKLDDILKAPMNHTDEIIKALKKAGPKDFIIFGGKFKIPLTDKEITMKLFQRKVYYSELANKLTTITKKGATSGLGKSMSKGTLRTLEGLTNGMAGGPAAILIQAFCFAQATKAAIDAPKGEKLSTFMENVFQDLGYYLVGTSSLNLLHRLGGNKYRGMTEATLKQYKGKIADTNLKIAAGQIDKVGLKAAKKEAKALLKAKGGLEFWERPFKSAGKLLAAGLDKFEPLIKQNDTKFVKTLKKLGGKLKGFPGGLGRLILSMFVITPILIKPIVKLSHLIFGRPTKSVLDKEKDAKVDTAPAPDKSTPQGSTNYLDKFTSTNQVKTPQGTQVPVKQPVNAAAPVGQAPQSAVAEDVIASKKIKKESDSDKNNSNEVERTYVPSSTPTEFPDAPDDYSKINDIMKKADFVENETLKNL